MAVVMGYGQVPNFGAQPINRAAVAAAAHSVQAHRVYVGNLPYACGWRELKDFMREAGDVSFAEVLMGPDGRSKGCGVVEFSSAEGAQKAIAELSDRPLFGRPVFVREDRETQPRYGHQPIHPIHRSGLGGGIQNVYGQSSARQLFVSGLALTVTWRTLKDMFRQAGNVLRADVTAGKGTGTVLMSTESEALAAIATFNGSQIEGSRIAVREDRFANNGGQHNGYSNQYHISNYNQGGGGGGGFHVSNRVTIDPANQQPSTQIFVNNLPYSCLSPELMSLCPVGAVNAEVMSVGGRSKGMGIIEYASLEAAQEALGTLQGQSIGGRCLLVKYNERWHEFSENAVGPTVL
ncbi:hypothetical protein CROQUDRAFT_716317 [Cronartium quercuum f. sp. fusiforme G11]|uniref:RRM domain-containing protein n=1 Tax=Cronartium quercuum f. sp. fusiforme G11 TaxID=708437 RepID=A0A9P6NJ09_9BASI|nr:hypothetical protein CROQUDRAFT_716317 [Cronartium quercuum f. sp. fusiforme G11]